MTGAFWQQLKCFCPRLWLCNVANNLSFFFFFFGNTGGLSKKLGQVGDCGVNCSTVSDLRIKPRGHIQTPAQAVKERLCPDTNGRRSLVVCVSSRLFLMQSFTQKVMYLTVAYYLYLAVFFVRKRCHFVFEKLFCQWWHDLGWHWW